MLPHLLDLLFVLLVAFLALTIGHRLLRLVHVEFAHHVEEAVVCSACGLGVFAYVVLALGLCGLLTKAALEVVLGLALLQAIPLIPHLRHRWCQSNSAEFASSSESQPWTTPTDRIFLLLLFVNVGLTLFGALAPPSGNDYDSLVYHLASPKIYLSHHRIHYIPFDHHSNFPFTIEMLYTLGLGLRGPVAAKLFHFMAYMLTLLALYLFGQTYLSRRAGMLAVLTFSVTPVVFSEASTAYVDIGLAMFTVLAFYSLFQWTFSDSARLRADPSRWWIPTALFSGWMMGTKYLGAVIFLAVVVIAIVQARQSHEPDPRFAARKFAGLMLLSGLVALPWYLKNYLWTGNPAYPFAYNIFHGHNWSADLAKAYWTEQKSYGDRSLIGLLLTPWRVSFYPFNPTPIRYEVEKFLGSAVGPLYLLFGIPLFFIARPRPVKVLLAAFTYLLLCWFVIMQYNRYFTPCLALLSVPVGYAVGALQDRSRGLRWITVGAFFTIVFLSIGLNALMNQRTLSVALGVAPEEAYLEATLDNYSMCRWINANLPEDARIITYGEPRGFYLDREYLWGDPGHHRLIEYEKIHSFVDLESTWRRLRMTHVLINQQHFRLDTGGGIQGMVQSGLESGKLQLVYETWRGRFLLMRIVS